LALLAVTSIAAASRFRNRRIIFGLEIVNMTSTIEKILDLGRWAPSGDNTQNWRFEITGEEHVIVHGFDTRDHCVYDLDGHPSQISLGALLETISIAASGYGMRVDCTRRVNVDDLHPTFDLHFVNDSAVHPDSLISSIQSRSVQRRPLKTRPLTGSEKQSLEAAVGASYQLQWIEGFAPKLQAAKLMFNNAKLRLTMPEAYEVHRDVIQWNARYSEDKVPDQALGADAMTVRLMRWVMQSWKRVEFFNTFLAGTWAPRIQMDFIPSLACAAHFVIKARREPKTIDDYVAAGRAVQRFWLTVTELGLHMQPEMTPVIFSRYVKNGLRFSRLENMFVRAQDLKNQIDRLLVADSTFPVFMGRVGAGSAPESRSIRLPLSRLMKIR
jgi:hypothetical protein